MKTHTIRVSETSGMLLDYLVAKCNGDFDLYHGIEDLNHFRNVWRDSAFLHYSSNWANAGPIIERERIQVSPDITHHIGTAFAWNAHYRDNLFNKDGSEAYQLGPTPLVAAMRSYVIAKLGNEVEVPIN